MHKFEVQNIENILVLKKIESRVQKPFSTTQRRRYFTLTVYFMRHCLIHILVTAHKSK